MATTETLTATIDRLIALFNAKGMDLPDGFFDRRTQFVLNGAPFETLLGQPPTDPLVLMLARGPAGYRFMAKALQHALPDARVERAALDTGSDPFLITTRLRLSGTLRGSGGRLDTAVAVTLKLGEPGRVGVAEAVVDPGDLDRLRAARLEP
ncbi:MAG: hypothetical protein Q8T13_07830 [Acidobacteriota bacterium]|nr:hypothetical protein [Acidobacteriota bacterium]